MSQSEIDKDLENKKKIFMWLIKNKIRSLEDFGKIMNLYYNDKEELLNDISKNDIKKILGR